MADIKKLEKGLWKAADNLRANSKLTGQQYCMSVLGPIFLRYAWSCFRGVDTQIKEKRPQAIERQVPIEAAGYTKRGAMFLPEKAHYDYLLNLPENTANIGKRVDDSMAALERQNPQLIGVPPRTYTDLGSDLPHNIAARGALSKDIIYVRYSDKEALLDAMVDYLYDHFSELKIVIDTGDAKFDISVIDFDLLHREFEKKTEKNLILVDVRVVIERKLELALQQNPIRAGFFKRYESIINQYNKEEDLTTIKATFETLMKLSQDLDDEQRHYVREGFTSEEQLAVFDMIYKDFLSKENIKKMKNLCVELVETVQKRLSQMLRWTEKPEVIANVNTLIRYELYKNLPGNYPDESIAGHHTQIFDYFYSRAA